jgi:peptide/nickel transport system ATP-binding protein
MAAPLLDIQSLSISFQGREVLRNVSLQINPAETLGLVGESGSGKSLTSLSILRLNPGLATGSIWLQHKGSNIDVLKWPKSKLPELRGKSAAMIFQEPMTSLNPYYTCGFQVMEALRVHEPMNAAQAKARCLELFKEVQLPRPEAMLRAYPHQISGGQKQRVMIAMAISCSPGLLIADEPTTALDATVQNSILGTLRSLQDERGMSMLFISHDLGVVSSLAHRIAVLYRGDLVEQGAVKDIVAHPTHPYTRSLWACRPRRMAAHLRPARLPSVEDFLAGREQAAEFIQPRTSPAAAEKPLLEVSSLSVHYPLSKSWLGRPKTILKAVDGVDFTLNAGQTLGLVGESGCGKSTLGKALVGLAPVESGSIHFGETNLRTLSGEALRKFRPNVQLIFQDPFGSLNPYMSVGEAIAEPLWVHRRFSSARSCRGEAKNWMERVGLSSSMFDRYPAEFSGGQRQRIGIARALALKPQILICDESVAALDVSVQAQVLNLLRQLQEEEGFACLFISHDLPVVHFMSDHILVMKAGKVVERGTAEDIFERPEEEYTRQLLRAAMMDSV